MEFKGSYVALVTPFKETGEVDIKKIKELVNFHIENGTNGIVPCGTTGEPPTLSIEEYKTVIQTVVSEVKGRIQVIAGAGSNDTKKSIELIKICEEIGVDAVLITCPYYNKPSQRGIISHYESILNETNMPIIVYNVPSRTGVNIEVDTIEKLSNFKKIVAIKEATGSIEQMIEIHERCGDKIDILSGEDHLILPMLAIGCKGVISVSANIVPKEMSDLIRFYFEGEYEKAFELHKYLFNISRNMFIEGNPVTVKAAMKLMKILENDIVRLPLVSVSEETNIKLEMLLESKNLI